jgi:hypothetical protein
MISIIQRKMQKLSNSNPHATITTTTPTPTTSRKWINMMTILWLICMITLIHFKIYLLTNDNYSEKISTIDLHKREDKIAAIARVISFSQSPTITITKFPTNMPLMNTKSLTILSTPKPTTANPTTLKPTITKSPTITPPPTRPSTSKKRLARFNPTSFYYKLQNIIDEFSLGKFIPSTHILQPNLPWLKWISTFSTTSYSLYEKYSTNKAITECLRNKRILLLGTSYQRVLYWEILRVLDPWLMREPRNRLIAHNEFYFQNCSSSQPPWPSSTWTKRSFHDSETSVHLAAAEFFGSNSTINDDNDICYWVRNETICTYYNGLPGIDTITCGLPMVRTQYIEHTNTTLEFHFKTFLSTPIVDERFKQALISQHWDLVLTSGGEWGRGLPQFYVDHSYDKLGRDFLSNSGLLEKTKSITTIHRYQHHGFRESTKQFHYLALGKLFIPIFSDGEMFASLHDFDRGYRMKHAFEGPFTEASMRVMIAGWCATR